jgi:two-component system LytT family sensor kinase
MIPTDAASLISLLGFITGTILYAMLLWMVLSARPRSNHLALLTGILGIFWNLGSFAAWGLPGMGITVEVPLLLAMAFGALCFLPAVVVHSTLRTGEGWAKPWNVVAVTIAYSVSAVATVFHFHSAIVFGSAPSHVALRGMTIGFVGLLAALLLITGRQQGWARGLWVAALAVLSALHLSGDDHGGEDPWWLALLGHHASLPLALAILYQDYRFALADIFLKRALSLILLVGMVFGVYGMGAAPLLAEQPMSKVSLLLLMAMWAGTALAYPVLRSAASWFVDTVVLRRANYARLLLDTSRALEKCESPETILQTVASVLAPALTSESLTWTELKADAVVPEPTKRGATVVLVPTAEAPQFALSIGLLSGGRRLLSDDQSLLDRLALVAGRRIDAVRAMRERYERDLREQEVRKLAAEAELRALRAQINPHFLFNALTTIAYLIQTAPERALSTMMRLSGLLRSVLHSSGQFATLGEEIELIEAYLDIESARFEDRLRVRVEIPGQLRSLEIPALILQPLVENAIKHGIARSISGGEVRIAARLENAAASDTAEDTLILTVADTGAGAGEEDFLARRTRGVGLQNVERRIQLHGGDSATLSIQSAPGIGTVAEIRLPLEADASIETDATIEQRQ